MSRPSSASPFISDFLPPSLKPLLCHNVDHLHTPPYLQHQEEYIVDCPEGHSKDCYLASVGALHSLLIIWKHELIRIGHVIVRFIILQYLGHLVRCQMEAVLGLLDRDIPHHDVPILKLRNICCFITI